MQSDTGDNQGRYEDVEIAGVVQRFRWIPPGSFFMGSPMNEPGRLDDEGPQHEVEITRGFWMADTACTQALWEAVMGDNPSCFKGLNRPVETVSWDDCQQFIAKLNEELPGLELRLPTEAEWEYACRTGTTTPFSFGQTITTEQVNYDGNYPYLDGVQGLYRVQTVAVKSMPPNGWGLYEMHGNVWEWCVDWYGAYHEGKVFDPIGPQKGGDRVLRGGSWFGSARDCRSAHRYALHPADRYERFGFRLARGQSGRASGRDGAERSRVSDRVCVSNGMNGLCGLSCSVFIDGHCRSSYEVFLNEYGNKGITATDDEKKLLLITAVVQAHMFGDDGEMTRGQSRIMALEAIADILSIDRSEGV